MRVSRAALRKTAARMLDRRERANRTAPPAINVRRICHPKQARLVEALVLGRIRNICALAGRQSGKSHGAALGAVMIASGRAGVNVVYVTSTQDTCKRMAFLPAIAHNDTHSLGGIPNRAERYIAFPNGSCVYFMGADGPDTIKRLRGIPNLVLVIIDEAGVYNPDKLKELIKTVRPGLRPLAGKLCVMGTPSAAGKQGTWWEITENPQYDQHRFDYRDNDKVPTYLNVEALIDEDLLAEFPDLTPEEARKTAWFLREYMALFEVDLAEKVYQLTEANLVDSIPDDLDESVTGGDLGVRANDALVSIAWNSRKPGTAYVRDQEWRNGQDSIACAEMVRDHDAKRHPYGIAMDPGGLGQKTILTVKRLYPGIPIREAQKPPIAVQVRFLNSLLQGTRGWRLFILRGSKLAMELTTPTWVDGIVGGEIDEHAVHSDLVPCARYAAIEAMRLLQQVIPESTKPPVIDRVLADHEGPPPQRGPAVEPHDRDFRSFDDG